MEASEIKKWNDWDREGRHLEISLAHAPHSLRITATLQDQGVGYLEAKINRGTIDFADIFVQPEVNYRPESGFLKRLRLIPSRKNGIGSILLRGLVAFARKNHIEQITGVVLQKHYAENRYILEWLSKRGFIIDKTVPSDAVPPLTVASFRMVI